MQDSGTFIFSTTDLPLDTSGNESWSDCPGIGNIRLINLLHCLTSLGLAKEP